MFSIEADRKIKLLCGWPIVFLALQNGFAKPVKQLLDSQDFRLGSLQGLERERESTHCVLFLYKPWVLWTRLQLTLHNSM